MTGVPHLNLDACRLDPAYAAIKDAVVARTGMAFYRDRDDALARAVASRIAALGLADCEAYRRHLGVDGGAAEWETLVDDVTIGETSFFRYPAQFDALRDIVIPELVDRRRNSRVLRIWSAGCASGPEPYSIAILLESELAHLLAGWDVSILGTDISRGKLSRALAGQFTDWELRQLPERYRHDCFDRVGAAWRIRDAFRRRVSFKAQNLLEPSGHGPFDLILCRNVMIYFDTDTVRGLVRMLHRSVHDDGWLIVGHAEPHLEVANLFDPWPVPGATFYRKWADAPSRPALELPPSRVTPAPASRSIPLSSWTPPVLPEIPAMTVTHGPPADTPSQDQPIAGPLIRVRHLANAGDWSAATALCQQHLDRHPLDADAHYLMGLIRSHERAADAAGSFRRAIYLDRGFALAHYQLARAAAEAGDLVAARRSLRNVLAVLAAAGGQEAVRGGEGLSVDELRQLAHLQQRHLEAR